MRKMANKIIISAIIAAFLPVVGLRAEGHEPDSEEAGCYDREKKFEKIDEQLGLSAEQKETLKGQREEFAREGKELREKLRFKRKLVDYSIL